MNLCTCRNHNGDIPWNAARDYGREMHLEGITLKLFTKVILVMNALHRVETDNRTLSSKRAEERSRKNERRRKGFTHGGAFARR